MKKFCKFKSNVNSDLTKVIDEKMKMELKTFKVTSSKRLSESLTSYKKTNNRPEIRM